MKGINNIVYNCTSLQSKCRIENQREGQINKVLEAKKTSMTDPPGGDIFFSYLRVIPDKATE